jgi:hypothetical protein
VGRLIAKYADDLKNKCKVTPTWRADESHDRLRSVDRRQRRFHRRRFGQGELGADQGELPDQEAGPDGRRNLMDGINAAVDTTASPSAKVPGGALLPARRHFGKEGQLDPCGPADIVFARGLVMLARLRREARCPPHPSRPSLC